MSADIRRARVRALAKINLCLEVLNKRPDGFHNLRTIFQTISLADDIRLEVEPARKPSVEVTANVDIEGNLMIRAAEALFTAGLRAKVKMHLTKRIPMGGGLGGGSSDAAAVLRALPRLAGKHFSIAQLMDMAATLGSDVPFFLIGGTALGLGRGTELYPMSPAPYKHVLIVAPDIHVSTQEAYRSLARTTSYETPVNRTQQLALGDAQGWHNDFEQAVFAAHPELSKLRKKLERCGALVARMSGSGATLFGIFETAGQMAQASKAFGKVTTHPSTFVKRVGTLGPGLI
jgi:4-diphosphocytidyl-2-C-methyl-D-erythritol kinase